MFEKRKRIIFKWKQIVKKIYVNMLINSYLYRKCISSIYKWYRRNGIEEI